ncbi:MAG: hypothetical protein IVW56_00815 [Candidatus Binataceae bacterium]|nr:hypothetical protein [Candidatus Binataceae bacterium]
MTRRTHNYRWARRMALAISWIGLFAPSASAHGGMAGPGELGPPVGLSVGLGIICYWIMILWPTRREPPVSKSQNLKRRAISR